MTLCLCVMESAMAVGVGSCVAGTGTPKAMQETSGSPMGISTFRTDGVPRTTSYLYVGLVEAALAWPLTSPSPPRTGDRFWPNRVLETAQIARTVAFR